MLYTVSMLNIRRLSYICFVIIRRDNIKTSFYSAFGPKMLLTGDISNSGQVPINQRSRQHVYKETLRYPIIAVSQCL